MARFTIYQRQDRLRFDLLAVDAVPEIIGYLVMLVALGYAVVCAHVSASSLPTIILS